MLKFAYLLELFPAKDRGGLNQNDNLQNLLTLFSILNIRSFAQLKALS